jgi:hypothetical protein
MKSRTLLAPVLMGFGFVLGVPALGDDVSSDTGATTIASIDVVVVDAPANEMTLCLTLDTIEAPLPCVINADDSTLACVTLKPGDNYVVVPVVEPDAVGVTVMPYNPGIN